MKLLLGIFCIALVINFIVGDPIHLRPFAQDAWLTTKTYVSLIAHGEYTQLLHSSFAAAPHRH